MFSLQNKINKDLRVINCKSYKDQVDYFTCNKVFFLYDVGRYHNKRLYHYGETIDIDLVEYKLKKNLPYYKKLIDIPIDNCINGFEKLEGIIDKQGLKTKIPVNNIDDIRVLYINDDNCIQDLIDEINSLFKQDIESISN